MSNKLRICIELFHRDEATIQKGNSERLGWAIYHWAILLRPKDFKRLSSSVSFDVTDGLRLDPVNRTNLNSAGDWWFRIREKVNPLGTGHFLGAIQIGKLPNEVTIEQLSAILSKLPLPQRYQTPDQNCATWVFHAVQALQQAGYLSERDTQKIMNEAMALATEVMANGPPKKPENRFRLL